MILKVAVLMLATLVCCECVYVYSSFWAPLFNPRLLNYKVDAKFDPQTGKSDSEEYQKNYGYRGESLVADLGNGKGINQFQPKNQNYGEVKFYYTYPGANENEVY